MKEKYEVHMLCCDCGYAVKRSTMFVKAYNNTAICLCKKCARELQKEISEYLNNKEKQNDIV